MFTALRSLILEVDELPGAKAWYAELLGFPPYFDEVFYVGFDVGGCELGLMPAQSGRTGVGRGLAYWRVADADAALAALIAAGATALEAVHDVGGGIRLGSAVDPFGNAVAVISDPTPPGVRVVEPGIALAAADGEVSERAIVVRAVCHAPPAELWRRWTTAQGITSFFSPKATIELKIGGRFEPVFLLDQPPGLQGAEGCRVLSYLPERMLSFTWNSPPNQPTRGEHTWCVVELAPHAAGTAVTFTHTGWPAAGLAAGAPWEDTFRYFAAAWPQVIDNLCQAVGGSRTP